MSDQTAFSVRRLIRDAVRESGSTDVGELARKVAPQVPDAYRAEVLEQALRGLVRDVLAENRPRGEIGVVPQPSFRAPAPPELRPVPPPTPVPAPVPARPVPAVPVPTRPVPVPAPVPAAPAEAAPALVPASAAHPEPAPTALLRPAPSRIAVGGRKGAEIRDAWQKVLESHYTVDGERKQLGDLTYDDCQWIAASMDKQADDLKARARGFRRLGALLEQHQAATIRDLPAEIKMQALGARS